MFFYFSSSLLGVFSFWGCFLSVMNVEAQAEHRRDGITMTIMITPTHQLLAVDPSIHRSIRPSIHQSTNESIHPRPEEGKRNTSNNRYIVAAMTCRARRAVPSRSHQTNMCPRAASVQIDPTLQTWSRSCLGENDLDHANLPSRKVYYYIIKTGSGLSHVPHIGSTYANIRKRGRGQWWGGINTG